jgi:poly(3-hydroxybutyrate) depolymerase
MTRQVMSAHGVDADRVYVAGLSAGAAMADILGREYPDLYAAVGVHSGLPQGAAHDVASAFAAMHHGPHAHSSTMPFDGVRASAARTGDNGRGRTEPGAPTIVFHGDADGTVHASNGDGVVDAALRAAGRPRGEVQKTTLKSSAAGRAFTRTVYRRVEPTSDDASLAEHWVVHGAGHAWSGGSPSGSFADASGPDASREMIRFFEEHPLRRANGKH